MTKESGSRYQVDKCDAGFFIVDTTNNEPVVSFPTQEDCQVVADGMNSLDTKGNERQ